ncbi:MAG: DUF1131 family protein [Plesiomonas sp.]|uniref:DUF1131 family protein n=1 Tax=Plesiomonas sp. TaxID=2486279 RepID=UPI003F39DFCF
MKHHAWIITLPLLLAGCSTFSGDTNTDTQAGLQATSQSTSHWWSPVSWFRSDSTVINGEQVLGITQDTPLTADTIQEKLGDQYQVRTGMQMQNGEVQPYAEALRDNQRALVLSGKSKDKIDSITIYSPKIETEWGTHVGSVFVDIYPKALGAHCRVGIADEQSAVICQAPQAQQIHYIFSGQWSGPQGLLPPDDVLRTWKVQQMIWQTNADSGNAG